MASGLRFGLAGAIILLAVSAALFTTGCKSTNAKGSAEAGQTTATAPPLSGMVVEGRRVVQVTARRYTYIPSKIYVNEGETVRLELTAVDVMHGFNLKDYRIDLTLPPGVTQIVEFNAGKPGTHKFHCDVYCGLGHAGMKGEIVVLATGGGAS